MAMITFSAYNCIFRINNLCMGVCVYVFIVIFARLFQTMMQDFPEQAELRAFPGPLVK